jgi:hypothetical protein
MLAIAALAIISIAGASIYSSRARALPGDEPVAKVNGSPVTVTEFKRELERQRSSVIDYFHRTYGAKIDSHFWKAEFNGENPERTLKQRVMKEIVRIKVELELFRQHGLIQGISHVDLIREMDKENERRLNAVRAKQPVYGPVQLDEMAFMNIYLSKRRNELKEKLSEDELKVDDEDLKHHYEQIKDQMFANEDRVRFEKLTITYKDAGSGSDEGRWKKNSRFGMDTAKRLADQGKELAEVAKELQGGDGTPVVRTTEEELNGNTAGTYFKFQPALYSILTGGLQTGQISPVIDEAAQGEYVLIKVTGRDASGYKSFEENSHNVWNRYMDAAYSTYLNKLVEEARVNIYSKAWNEISLR